MMMMKLNREEFRDREELYVCTPSTKNSCRFFPISLTMIVCMFANRGSCVFCVSIPSPLMMMEQTCFAIVVATAVHCLFLFSFFFLVLRAYWNKACYSFFLRALPQLTSYWELPLPITILQVSIVGWIPTTPRQLLLYGPHRRYGIWILNGTKITMTALSWCYFCWSWYAGWVLVGTVVWTPRSSFNDGGVLHPKTGENECYGTKGSNVSVSTINGRPGSYVEVVLMTHKLCKIWSTEFRRTEMPADPSLLWLNSSWFSKFVDF